MLSALGVLSGGLVYDSSLLLVNVDLPVTMDLMDLINLVHGALTMAGSYVCVVLMNRPDVSFLVMLLIALVVAAIIGFVFECTLYRRLYRAGPLDQVLFSIALVFIAMAGATYV